jgi:hypothetical protein
MKNKLLFNLLTPFATSYTEGKTFRNLLALFMVLLGMGFSWGQYWNGTSTSSNSGSISNITSVFGSGNNNGTVTMISTTSASSGYTTASNVVSTGTSNFGVAALNQTLSTSTSSYFSVTLTPTSTYAVTLASINFGNRATGSGPTVLTVYSSIDNYTTAIGSTSVTANSSWAAVNINFTGSLTGAVSTAVTLRIYGSGCASSGGPSSINWRLDDVTMIASAASNSSVSNPATFTAITSSNSAITLASTANANSNNIIVAYNTTNSFGTPADATSYAVNASLPSAGTVIYNGTAAGLSSHPSLTANTQYYYKAWSYDGSTNYSSGTTANAITKIAEADVTNSGATTITATTATASGTIASTGTSSLITARGVAYSTTSSPTSPTSTSGTGFGSFNPSLTGLTPQTLYYARAYGTNGGGTTYAGSDVSFRTLSSPPTAQPTSISATATSYSSLSLSLSGAATFPASNATSRGYLLLYGTAAPSLIASPNGNAPASVISSGIQLSVTETNTSTTPTVTGITASGLSSNTNYYLLIVPYTWDGVNSATYYYLTSSARTSSVTTLSDLATLSTTAVFNPNCEARIAVT